MIRTFKEHLNLDEVYEREISLFSFLTKDTHEAVNLGVALNRPVYLFKSKTPNGILMTAGWQGDEPAGWEACKVLCKTEIGASYIPYVSPDCFLSKQHTNGQGRNVDRDFADLVTHESRILDKHLKTLVSLGEKCMISLQEDRNRPSAYFYGWNMNSNTESVLKKIMKENMPIWLPGIKEPADRKGMFAAYIVDSGAEMSIQLETPADGTQPLQDRIDCQVDAVKALLSVILKA